MASSLSEMLGRGTGREQRSDGTTGGQLTRAAGRGMREMVKEVVKEAIAESEAESRRSRGGSGRGMAMLGLGAIAGYLVRDWQLRPEMYEEIEEEFAELPEEAMEAREESTDDGGSRMGRLARGAGLVLLAVVGFTLVRRRRRSKRADQWTEQRGQEAQGGMGGEMGGDAGRMGGEGGETSEEGGEQTSGTGGESGGREQETTTGGASESSTGGSSSSGSSESSEDEESSE